MDRDVEDLRARIKGALEGAARIEARVGRSSNLPTFGDLYTFPITADQGIEWAVVLTHTDDAALWFVVPFDQNPLVGTWDVASSELSDAGAGTIRCGRGIWIHGDDFAFGEKSGLLEDSDVAAVRNLLSTMVAGQATSATFHPEVDDDPDYREWLEIVSQAAESLESSLKTPPVTLSLASAGTDWTSAVGTHGRSLRSLAADSGGLGSGPKEVITPLPGIIIPAELPGTLVAVRETNGERLLYHPTTDELPPMIRVTSPSVSLVISWRTLPGGVSESIELVDISPTPIICIRDKMRIRLSP